MIFLALLLAASGGPTAAVDPAADVARSLTDDVLGRYAGFVSDPSREGLASDSEAKRLFARHGLTLKQVRGLKALTETYYANRAEVERIDLTLRPVGPDESGALRASSAKLKATMERWLGALRGDLSERYGDRVVALLDAHWPEFSAYYAAQMNRPAPPFSVEATAQALGVARALTDEELTGFAAVLIETLAESEKLQGEAMRRVAHGEDALKVRAESRPQVSDLQKHVEAAARRHGLAPEKLAGLGDLNEAYYSKLAKPPPNLDQAFAAAYGEATLALLKKHWPEFQTYYESLDDYSKKLVQDVRKEMSK